MINTPTDISNQDLLDDEEFEADANDFSPYEHDSFYYQVQTVADRIFNIHMARGVTGEFIFGFESNYEGDVSSATVGLAAEVGFSLYLIQNIDLKHLTDDREATAHDQAFAIRDALMNAYDQVRAVAISKGLI